MKVRRDMLPVTARNGSIYETFDGQPITVVALAEDTASSTSIIRVPESTSS